MESGMVEPGMNDNRSIANGRANAVPSGKVSTSAEVPAHKCSSLSRVVFALVGQTLISLGSRVSLATGSYPQRREAQHRLLSSPLLVGHKAYRIAAARRHFDI